MNGAAFDHEPTTQRDDLDAADPAAFDDRHDTRPAGPAPARPRAISRAAGAVACILLLFAAVGGAFAGHAPMVDLARDASKKPVTVRVLWPEMPEDVIKRARARGVTGPITWMDPDSQRELTKLVHELVSDDPFDFESLRAAQHALMQTGWFASPVHLSRSGSGLIEVRGQWRVPFAAVRVGSDDRIVTRDGELLSPVYKPDQSRLKLIFGAQLAPPALGEKWLGGDVQAGLHLLEFLRPMPGYEQVAGIDVSEYQQHRTLTIVTLWQTRITWGESPREFAPGQAPPEVKRARLASIYTRFGRIDSGRAQLDCRTEDGIYIVADPAIIGPDDAAASKPRKPADARPKSQRTPSRRR